MRWLSTLLLLGLAVLAWAVAARPHPQIEIDNRTGRTMVHLEFVVADQSATLMPLGLGASDRQIVPLRAEGPVRLRVQFDGLPPREFQVGWFVPGQAGVPTFVFVTPDSVRFEAR